MMAETWTPQTTVTRKPTAIQPFCRMSTLAWGLWPDITIFVIGPCCLVASYMHRKWAVLCWNFQVFSVVQSYEYVYTASRSNVLSAAQNVCALCQSRPGTADCVLCLSSCHNGSLITYTAIFLTALTFKHHKCCGAWSCGLLTCWGCGFESRWVHGSLSVSSVACCQVEISASGWSLVQKSPTYCGASNECDREAP